MELLHTKLTVKRNTRTLWNGKKFKRIPGGIIKLSHGKGAGYIGGWTVFFAYNSGSYRYAKNFRGGRYGIPAKYCEYMRIGKLEIGFTHNANLVPYAATI